MIKSNEDNMKKDKLIHEFNKINKNSTLKEIQEYITKMMEANGFHNKPLELFCYLTEEVGELAKEIRKTEQNMGMDVKKEYDSCLKYEIADIFIYLLAICDFYHIDLLEAFQNKEKINLYRDWN
jgi:NTP pyrophosphatase (non-canonical NTP hydrolase)